MIKYFKNLNLPNKLTVIRMILVPVFIICLYLSQDSSTWRLIALIVFCVASFTDYLDGNIARARNLITNFGKLMDPLADKLLVCSAFICFAGFGTLPAWVTVIIVGREFIISGFRLVAAEKGVVIAASKWGKAKTVSQMITVILLIINQPKIQVLTTILIVVMTILTVVSLIDYIAKNKDVLKD